MKVVKKSALLTLAVVLAGCGGGSGGGGGVGIAGLESTQKTESENVKASATSTSAVASKCSAMGSDIVDAQLNVVSDSYVAMAAQMSKEAGIAYRYGSADASSCGLASADLPTWPQRENKRLSGLYSQTFPTYYQVGGPQNKAFDDYSSNHAQVAFVADNPSADVGGVGVASLETLAMRENTFTMSPGLPWVGFGSGLDDSSALAYNARGPVAIGRGYGRWTWNTNALMAFQNGLLGGAGSNTSTRKVTAQLDAGYVPTAVAVTNGGEFAFITVWDTVNIKGKLAVVALSEQGGDTWRGVAYPGLPNQGAWGFMKIVGYVDLPDMKAPTDVSVTTGVDSESMNRIYLNNNPQHVESTSVDLRIQSNWASFGEGGANATTFARGGIAVVLSKSEKKASFIDLKPLMDHYRNTYFTSRGSFDAAINNLGQGANQWPQTFSAVPSQTPTVIKTVSLDSRPTAVKVALHSNQRGWIATEDGTLHIYSLGAYLNGGSSTPGAIAAVGSVGVGKNPTSIAYDKKDVQGGKLMVVSRGERKIDWVSFSGNGGSVVRTLRDSRLIDPISAEDNDNHGTDSSVLTVADYGGKQIANYSYGPVYFYSNPGSACSNPCGMTAEFEFGGAYGLPGKPFQVTGANVP